MIDKIERLYSCKQVAEIMGLKPRTIRYWVGVGIVKAVKIVGSIRIPESELLRLTQQQEDHITTHPEG